MAGREARMVPVSLVTYSLERVLHIVDPGHAGTAEEIFRNFILGELTLAQVEFKFAVSGQHAAVCEGCRRDPAGVAAERATLTDSVGYDGVVGDLSLAGHHLLRNRSAVKEDTLIRIVSIVVVPVQAGGGITGGQAQCQHRDGVTDVYFAGGRDAPVVQFAQYHAR